MDPVVIFFLIFLLFFLSFFLAFNNKLVRPGDPRVPCLAILQGRNTSELKLVNLEGGSSSSVKISDKISHGVVTIDGEVFAVTVSGILKLLSDGTAEHLRLLPELDSLSRVISFQKKIYIIQPSKNRPWRESMLCFDPADNSLTDDLPGCWLGEGFCASATDDFIYAMGGLKTETRAMKYNPLTRAWEDTAPMRTKRMSAAAATLDGMIYVMGGLGGGDWGLNSSVEYYNPGNNSWTEISNMNVVRYNFSACVVGDRLYAVGGDGFVQQSIEVYDKYNWTVVTKFQTNDWLNHSCFWPRVSHQPGGVSTEVKAPVSQLAIGNADFTEQGAGSNYVAGIFQITDDIFMNKEKPLKEGAIIYEGYQEHVGGQRLPLAIKVIFPCMKKSVKEVQHLISLASHPNVMQTILFKEHNDGLPTLYIAMELCSSQNLQDYLNENRKKNIPFDFKKTMLYSEGLIHGIKHIHCKRIIHGDLKPANILFSLDGDQIKVSDFGIGKELRQFKFGGYRAPETYNFGVISMKADIYSLGIILYSLFTNGKHPFGEDLDLWPYNIKTNVGRYFSGLPEEMGAKKDEFLKLLEKMLEFDPEKRLTIEEISEHPFFNSNRATTAQEMRNDGNVTHITYNITGEALTVINAPVGQVATGYANITNQGSGNNFVAGLQENTDRSVTVGRVNCGESTSSSVVENITVHRTGK